MKKQRKHSEYNIFLLFVGLSLGFFLGGIAMYLHSERQNDRILHDVLNQLSSMFTEMLVVNTKTELPAEIIHTTNIPTIEKPESLTHLPLADTTMPDSISWVIQDIDDLIDEIYNNLIDTPVVPAMQVGSELRNISLAQDKLLMTKKIIFPGNQERKSLSEHLLDSLLGNTHSQSRDQVVYVEFWESPLNSLGYRMSKNKIVLYGIKLIDFTSILQHNNTIYLKYLNDYYPLELTNSYRPLIPLHDTSLVDQIQ